MIAKVITVSVLLVLCMGLSVEESLGQSPEAPRRLAIRSAVMEGNMLHVTPVDDVSFSVYLRNVVIAEPDTTLDGTYVEVYLDPNDNLNRVTILNRTRSVVDKWKRTIDDAMAPRDVKPTVRK